MKSIYLFCCLSVLLTDVCASGGAWQQEVDFRINVRLDDAEKKLEGDIRIRYVNNSPDSLREIHLHIWPNAYSRYNTAFARQLLQQGDLSMSQALREDLGAIGNFEFRVDDVAAAFNRNVQDPDIGVLVLNESLPPGGSIEISTPFTVKVPKILSRLGYLEDFFAISQWYPKPAVYDADGWHPMPYLDQGEFYSDFGKYVVSIDVPERYDVAATGKRIRDVSESGRRTLIYEQEDIIDFAWFASPDFIRDIREVTLPDGKRVVVQVCYTDTSGHWEHVGEMAENALKFYSERIGSYPYEVMTIVQGPLHSGSGMEYPTITVIQDTRSIEWLEVVVAHEIGHNWWQAAMANNERLHPWIDEGFNSYYEERYLREAALRPYQLQGRMTRLRVAGMFGLKDLSFDDFTALYLLQPERLNANQAPSEIPVRTTRTNYEQNHYYKMPVYIRHMAEYIGQEAFDDCIRSFYREYAFKHIGPDELQDHLESCSGKDLGFLFQERIGTPDVADTRIKRVVAMEEHTEVEIARCGIDLPVQVKVSNDTASRTAWIDAGEHSANIELAGATRVEVDPGNLTLDYDRGNNLWKSRGIHKLERISPWFLGSVEKPDRSQLFVAPVLAGNVHDKFMLGMALYNRVWPARDVDWSVVPLYAFGSRQFNGIFNFSWYQNIRGERSVQIGYHAHFKTFSYNNIPSGGRYLNFAPSVTARILTPDRTRNISHLIEFKYHQTWREQNAYERQDSVLVLVDHSYFGKGISELRYTLTRDDVKTPVEVSAYSFINSEVVKIGTELNVKIRYGKVKSYIHGRFFMEGFAYTKNDFAGSSNFFPPYRSGLGGTTGPQDYLYEDLFLGRGRSDGFASRQVYADRGQFKFSNAGLLRADALVTSVNIRADFPSKYVPIQLYMDFGLAMNSPGSGLFAFQAGGILSLFDQGLEIYFPFFSSSEIKNFYDLNVPKYRHRITFSFDMDKLNIHKRIRDHSF